MRTYSHHIFLRKITITLNVNLQSAIEKAPEFEGVFDSPHRMRILDKELGEKCRNVKNQFRKHARNPFS